MTADLRFYIHHANGMCDGPYDLPAMIRKTRTGKVVADTVLSMEENAPVTRAADCRELAHYFQIETAGTRASGDRTDACRILGRTLGNGWRFVGQQPSLCAMSGA